MGSLKLLNQDKLTNQLSDIKKKNILLQNFLIDLEFHEILDSTKRYEKFIFDYYDNNDLELPSQLPVNGYVTRGINKGANHFGIDIAAKFQDDIYSPGDGKVIFSGKNDDLGNTIILNHPGGFITVFAHTDSNIVVAGMSVKKGQIIAYVGETGNSKGPHLHFEMWKNTEVLDPREIILEYKQKDVSIR